MKDILVGVITAITVGGFFAWGVLVKYEHREEQAALDRELALTIAKIERGDCDPFYEAQR